MHKQRKIYVILDRVRSLYNVGAFFRTCDGVGVEKLYLCGLTPTPEHKSVKKTALGADKTVAWEYFSTTKECVDHVREQGIPIIAVETGEASVLYTEYDYPETVCFLFGNEVEGVSESLLEEVDGRIFLPMLGKKHSLNVAVCGGVVLYNARR